MKKIAIWNNKGGTGKTTLAFQTACMLAKTNRELNILILDLCPQANLSELFLGSLNGNGGTLLEKLQKDQNYRKTVGGYFQNRFKQPYANPDFQPEKFLITPSEYNHSIPGNIKLLCGDPIVEIQAEAISSLANADIPGVNTWKQVQSWLIDFVKALSDTYQYVFIDTNPSFAIYTQLALICSDELYIPVMADDSSRRSLQNALALLYGIGSNAQGYESYSFNEKLRNAGLKPPKIGLVINNRTTQYMGQASAYRSVLSAITGTIKTAYRSNSDVFVPDFSFEAMIPDIRDFQTTGVVASAEGCPFISLNSGKHTIEGRETQITKQNISNCQDSILSIVSHITRDRQRIASFKQSEYYD